MAHTCKECLRTFILEDPKHTVMTDPISEFCSDECYNKWLDTHQSHKPIQLGIALPLTDDKCHSSFLDSFVRMKKPAFTYLRPKLPCAAPIDKIRNSLVHQARESECTHLLMMDTDQVYPPDTIERLMVHAAGGLDIVCAKVHRRYPPFDPLLLTRNYSGEFLYETMPMSKWHGKGLVEVDATGCGCMLINMSVFDRICSPWFELRTDTLEDGTTRMVGEDVSFCEKAKHAGIHIYVDTNIKVGHIASMLVQEEMHFLYCKLEELKKKAIDPTQNGLARRMGDSDEKIAERHCSITIGSREILGEGSWSMQCDKADEFRAILDAVERARLRNFPKARQDEK